jgi:hypothetical protein
VLKTSTKRVDDDGESAPSKPKGLNSDLTVVDMNRRTYSASCQADYNTTADTICHSSLPRGSTPIVFDPVPARRLSESSRGEGSIYFVEEGNDSRLGPHDQFARAKSDDKASLKPRRKTHRPTIIFVQ